MLKIYTSINKSNLQKPNQDEPERICGQQIMVDLAGIVQMAEDGSVATVRFVPYTSLGERTAVMGTISIISM